MSGVPNALRLAHLLDIDKWPDAAAELHRLLARVQELESIERQLCEQADVAANAYRELESEAEQNANIIGASAEKELALRARVEELGRELAAIGAGGVEPLRKRAAAPQAVQAAVPDGWREALAKRLIADVQVADTIATSACQRVAELPGRDSHADWPEAMLVTSDELHMIVREAVIEAQTAPAHPAEGAQPSIEQDVRAIVGLLKNREWAEHIGNTELGRELESEITNLYNSTHPAPQGLDAQTIKHISALSELVRMPNAEYFADAHNAAVRHLRALAAQTKQGEQP